MYIKCVWSIIIEIHSVMVTFSKLGDPFYGRLGNQLFQIAATIAIAEKNRLEFVFPEWGYSEYFKNKLPAGTLQNVRVYNQQSLNYYNVVLTDDVNWDLRGFFQSEKFFCNAEQLVRHYFEPSIKIVHYIKDKYATMLAEKTCSIHIRRGDYVKKHYHFPNQPIEYYTTAIKKIGDDSKFLIFSDDMVWCKQNFKGNNIYFIENETDIVDIFLMSYCNDHIISNSSFSWWGAWLNTSDSKIIICPEYWFGKAVSFNHANYSKDIFSPNFQKLILPKKNFINRHPLIFDPIIFIYYRSTLFLLDFLKYIGRPAKRLIKGIK